MNTKNVYQGSYTSWLKEQLTSIPTSMWTLFGFGFGLEVALFLTAPINWISFITFFGTVFGMACVCSMASGHTINGLLGAISVVAYIAVNISAHHWFSVIDQLCFFFLIDLPLMMTWRTWGRGNDSEIKQLRLPGWALTILCIIVEWFVFYQLALVTLDSNPFWDSLALAVGATASYLCYKRYTQTYTLWLFSDFVNIALWFYALKDGYSQAALPMLAMTLFYTASAIYGRFFAIWNGKQNQ